MDKMQHDKLNYGRDQMDQENSVKNCCLICSHEFDEVRPINQCHVGHYGEQEFSSPITTGALV